MREAPHATTGSPGGGELLSIVEASHAGAEGRLANGESFGWGALPASRQSWACSISTCSMTRVEFSTSASFLPR